MIKFTAVSKTYDKTDVKALDNLTLSINDGEIFAFLGQNGAGKTTAIKLLCGILAPDCGDVFVDGIAVERQPVAAKRRLALVSDEPDLPLRFTGGEYLRFVAEAFGIPKKEANARIKKYAELFSIESKLGSVIGEYSHGMKQKLQLAASLLGEPHNWILDEPLTGLDPEAAFGLKEVMRERAKQGKTVFFSTHIMEVAEKLCDRIAVLRRGSLLFTGTLKDLRKEYALPNSADSENSLESIFLRITNSRE